ncbi:MAG: DegV family EDD domain-containing protein [Butyrivibrio sp.]|nr:DegV family EDD domain-containing protein [Butyrivibrio sp.]
MSFIERIRKSLHDYFYNPAINLKDRTFVLFSMCEIMALFVTGIYDYLLLDKTVTSTVLTLVASFFFAGLLYYSVKMNRLRRARLVVSLVMIFVAMPGAFFTKGGVSGGALTYILLGSYFLVMVLDGKLRSFLCTLNICVILCCGVVSYYRPEFLIEYTRKGNHIDSIGAYIFSFFLLAVMSVFHTNLYMTERQNAREKAKALEELNRSQNRFFSSMSHEIRTPINTVLGFNEIILRQEDASEEIRKDARNIQGAGKYLLALINDILDVSKIEAGKMDIVPVDYDVAALLSEIVNMFWLKAEEKGLAFNVDIDPNVPKTLFGDEVRIKQVLINLLNNAVKYTREGSVGLHMECDFSDSGDALLKISVSDTGIGIKPESLPHLFDSFRREDEEKNRHIEGTGLGLSIVKQLVELMDGEIKVNSVYAQGSSFEVSLRQGVSSEERLGDLNITGSGKMAGIGGFEHRFHAPSARILIVDDNDMNLQVEKKLLDGTEMTIDLAHSGKEALANTLRYQYDVIFMDHLMPVMDGIECFERIRSQKGGLNMSTPVVVLTANAGGENIELYNDKGFDGYLVKPVSGHQLEDMLLLHLPDEKVVGNQGVEMTGAAMSTARRYAKKKAVAVAINTTCDLPKRILQKLDISTISCTVFTDEGAFFDNVDINSEELIRYMRDESKHVRTDAPTEEEYIQFFSSELKRAHHLIFIAFTSSSSAEYERSVKAAQSFENVTVVNSECMSSASGILAMMAVKLAQQNLPVEKIVSELDAAKKRINCSFIAKSTDTIARQGKISPIVNNIYNIFYLRPVLRMKNDKLEAGHFLIGSTRKCYEKYITRAFSGLAVAPDTSLLFVPYVGMSEDDILWIEELIRERVNFDHIIFQKTSAGLAANCGEGTFGLQYLYEGEKSYNLGAYFDEKDYDREDKEIPVEPKEHEKKDVAVTEGQDQAKQNEPEQKGTELEKTERDELAWEKQDKSLSEPEWYENIDGLDTSKALLNSGSREMMLSLFKMYHESHDEMEKELQQFFDSEDWKNYTIKIHALKSSSRLVGASHLGDAAEALEKAGKDKDVGFIRDNHKLFMDEYRALSDALSPKKKTNEELPEIPEDILEDAYSGLSDFVMVEDADLAKMALDSLNEYRLPQDEEERVQKIRKCLSDEDWDGIKNLIDEKS